MKEILRYLNATYYKLSDDAMSFILQHCDEQTFRAGETLHAAGEVCKYVWFIKKGMLRAYQEYYDEDRKTTKIYNNWFMIENDTATSVVSFFRGVPSLEAIETVEDTVVYRMSREDLFAAIDRYPGISQLTLMVVIKYYCDTRMFEGFLRMKNSKGMHEYLLAECGTLMGRLEEKHKNSFLGISDTKYRAVKSGKSNKKKGEEKKDPKKNTKK